MHSTGKALRHNFLIFESLPCETDGILGHDFLKMYAKLDYELTTLHLLNGDSYYALHKLQTYITYVCNLCHQSQAYRKNVFTNLLMHCSSVQIKVLCRN